MEPYYLVDNFFTPKGINALTEYCESKPLQNGITLGTSKIRLSHVRFFTLDGENQWIFELLGKVIGHINKEAGYDFELNGIEPIQYTTYNVGGYYDWHMDTYVRSERPQEQRKLSLSILLNDDFEGGELQFNISSQSLAITALGHEPKGRIVGFPSFVLHRVTPVTKGTRKSLVVWVTGPKWK